MKVDLFTFLYDLMHKIIWIHVPDDHRWMLPIFVLVIFVAPMSTAAIIAYFATAYLETIRNFLSNSHWRNGFGIVQELERFCIRYTVGLQAKLVVISVCTIPLSYVTLLVPKYIVNGVLVDQGKTGMFPWWSLGAVQYLLLLCLLYLIAISLNNACKYIAKIIAGRINERIVRRIRLAVVRKRRRESTYSSRSTLSAIAIQECEPIGYFGGNLLVVPIIQGGTLFASLAFLFMQDVALAMAALVMLPLQIAVLPRIQKQINDRVRDRVHATRDFNLALMFSSEDSSENSRVISFAERVSKLEVIRCKIWVLKARFKTLYNYTSNLTPFFFFTIGGYLVLQGRLSLGALVAALAAYREIAPALREMFDFAQAWSDARSRFAELSSSLGWNATSREPEPIAAPPLLEPFRR